MNLKPGARWFHVAPLLSALLFLGCWTTDGARLAGDATETGNATLAGSIVDVGGQGVTHAEVFALPADFDPTRDKQPDSLRTQTDSKGRYAYAKLAPGLYNVFARHASGTASLRSGIEVTESPQQIDPDTLKAPGKIWVPLPENAVEGGYVYVPGTLVHAAVSPQSLTDGGLRLEEVPSGTISEIVYQPKEPDSSGFVVDTGVTVQPNAQTDVPALHQWKDSLTLRLNTSSQDSGINLRDTLYDFPLAIRLSAPDFHFDHALPEGRDLRLFKSNGGKIPYQIELWDSTQGALVWARIDTLLPGNSRQSIVAYYGNPTALAPASTPVFDTGLGFSGVWHLNEEFPDTLANASYLDASNAGNPADDRIASTGRDGVLGNGHSFEGSDYLEIPNAKSILKPNTFTLSAWVKSSQSDYNGEILSMGDNYGLRIQQDGNAYAFYLPPIPADSTVHTSSFVAVLAGGPTLNDGGWHFLSATLASDSLRLFMDGSEIGAKPSLGPMTYSNQLGNNFFVGKHGNGKSGFQLNGFLDEIEVQNRTRSPEWIRATFENQKPGSKFPKPE